MIYAQKGNRIHKIEEHQIPSLVEQGYDIVDEKGRVLSESVPTDPVVLRTAFIENKKRIEELENEIKALKAQKKAPVKKEETVAVEDEPVVKKAGRKPSEK